MTGPAISYFIGDTKENLIPAPFPDAYLKLNSSTFSKSSVINNDVFSWISATFILSGSELT